MFECGRFCRHPPRARGNISTLSSLLVAHQLPTTHIGLTLMKVSLGSTNEFCDAIECLSHLLNKFVILNRAANCDHIFSPHIYIDYAAYPQECSKCSHGSKPGPKTVVYTKLHGANDSRAVCRTTNTQRPRVLATPSTGQVQGRLQPPLLPIRASGTCRAKSRCRTKRKLFEVAERKKGA